MASVPSAAAAWAAVRRGRLTSPGEISATNARARIDSTPGGTSSAEVSTWARGGFGGRWVPSGRSRPRPLWLALPRMSRSAVAARRWASTLVASGE